MARSLLEVQSPRLGDTDPIQNHIMFQEAPPPYKVSNSRQILLMSAVLVVGFLSLSIAKNSRVYLFEQAQCLIYYQSHSSTSINTQNSIEESLCKLDDIQYPLSIVVGIDSCLTFLPALLALATYQQILPRMGLRYLAVLSLSCSALGVLFSMVVFWIRQPWSIYVAILSFAFDLVGGGQIVRLAVVSTCIAQIEQPEKLTKTYNYISAFYYIADFGGAAVVSLLLSHHVWLLNALSILCYALTVWIAILIPSECGRHLSDVEDRVPILASVEEPESPSSTTEIPNFSREASDQPPLRHVLLNSWYISYRSLLTLFRTSNPTLTVIILYLINGLDQSTQVFLPQYTSLVLHWPFATVNAALALKSLVSALVLFLLPTFRRLYLEPRMSFPSIDLLVTQACLLINFIGKVGLGLSTSVGLFILSLCIYTTGVGLQDSLCSYGALNLPPGEQINDFYLRIGLVQTIAGVLGAPLWSGIFSLVLKSEVVPFGLPLLVNAGLLLGGLFGAGALKKWHRNSS